MFPIFTFMRIPLIVAKYEVKKKFCENESEDNPAGNEPGQVRERVSYLCEHIFLVFQKVFNSAHPAGVRGHLRPERVTRRAGPMLASEDASGTAELVHRFDFASERFAQQSFSFTEPVKVARSKLGQHAVL